MDATPGSIRAFEKVRPRDVNVESAVSGTRGSIDFYWWAIPGNVNTASEEHARVWTRKLGRAPQITRVPAVTLEELLATHLPEGQHIDFLSVDVEGHDMDVISSNDWTKYRPELVMIESEVTADESLIAMTVTQYMMKVGYSLHAWLPPNLIFRDRAQTDHTES